MKHWTFRWWLQELARRDQQAESAAQSQQQGHPKQGHPIEAAPAFLPVRIVDQEPITPQPPPPIEIVWPTGPTVRVPAGFDRRPRDEILRVLEGLRC